MVENDIDEFLKELKKFELLNKIEEGKLLQIANTHLTIIISNYEKLQRRMVHRTESDDEAL